ncbi:hypothetical protein AKO1_008116 [Acrasis kona]|uniref:Uncharacterized protein n=1 Tax=Acrasis kona TaxID=1008807 RepID=A0AAW2YQC4_9EUKA
MYACASGSLEAVEYLCACGANVNHKDFYEFSPLLMALRVSDFRVADILLMQTKIDVNLKITTKGGTLLHYFCETGSIEALNYLLKIKDISLLRADRHGETCLFMAVAANPEIIKTICGASKRHGGMTFRRLISSHNQKYHNILHAWAQNESASVENLDILVKEIAQESYSLLISLINEQDKKLGNTPLHYLLRRKSKSEEHVEAYCNYFRYIQFWKTNLNGDTPLQQAVRSNDFYSVQMLASADRCGWSLCVIDAMNLTPELLSLELHRPKITQTLLSAKKTCNEKTPLHHIEQDRNAHAFTVLLFPPCNTFVNDLTAESIDRIYRAGGCLLELSTGSTEFVHSTHPSVLPHIMLSDQDQTVADFYNIKDERKSKKSVFKRIAEMRRGSSSQLQSLPIIQEAVPIRRAFSASGKKLSHGVTSKKSKNQPTELQDGIIVLDKDGTTLFRYRGDVHISETLDVIATCMSIKNQDTSFHHIINEPKDDVYDWAFRDERVVRSFVKAVVREWRQEVDFDIEKIIRAAGDTDKRNLLKRKFDFSGHETDDQRTLEIYEHYITYRNATSRVDARKDALLCFSRCDVADTCGGYAKPISRRPRSIDFAKIKI